MYTLYCGGRHQNSELSFRPLYPYRHLPLPPNATLNPLLLLPIKFQLRTSIPPQITHNTMLRRKPTSIILTTEDVATYVDSRRREALGVGENRNPNNDNNPSSATGESGKLDPNDELKPLPGDKVRINRVGGGVVGSSREERILGR